MATALSVVFHEIKPPDITKSGVEERSLTAHWISEDYLDPAACDLTLTTTPNTVKAKRVTKIFLLLWVGELTASQSKKSKQLISRGRENVGEPEAPQSSVPLASKTADIQIYGGGLSLMNEDLW